MALSDGDRLRLENDALLRIVQGFANIQQTADPRVAHRVHRARQLLGAIKARKKSLKPRDDLEETCFFIVNMAAEVKITDPSIVISRYGKNEWEAYIDKFENAEFIGVGMGDSPIEAARDLLAATKSYAARCRRGAEKHGSV